MRPPNCLMIGLAVVIAEVISLDGEFQPREAALGFSAAASLMASTMALNDLLDREVDAINSPDRPIPSRLVSPRGAVAVTLVLGAVALTSAALINYLALTIAGLVTFLMAYYNAAGKRTGLLGNVIVSICVALPFVFGGYAVKRFHVNLVAFTALAFLSNLGREVIKGIVDVKGDALKNVKTVAVMKGPRTAATLGALLIMSAVAASLVPLLLRSVSLLYMGPLFPSVVGFAYSSYSIIRDQSAVNARRVKNLLLVWMLLGLLAFLAGASRR